MVYQKRMHTQYMHYNKYTRKEIAWELLLLRNFPYFNMYWK